jgi:hypothetical protein
MKRNSKIDKIVMEMIAWLKSPSLSLTFWRPSCIEKTKLSLQLTKKIPDPIFDILKILPFTPQAHAFAA